MVLRRSPVVSYIHVLAGRQAEVKYTLTNTNFAGFVSLYTTQTSAITNPED